MTKKWAIWCAIPLAAMVIACSSGGADDKGEVTSDSGAAAAQADATTDGSDTKTDGVYKFGQTVKFKDGSTLTVAKPVVFKKSQYAAGGEGKKVFLKFKTTFKNNTKEIFDPALTTGSASAAGTEGEAVFQEGLDAPDNKILPGKSVSWWMGYGFEANKDVQLEVSMGFLDGYGTVVFTN